MPVFLMLKSVSVGPSNKVTKDSPLSKGVGGMVLPVWMVPPVRCSVGYAHIFGH